MMHRFNRPRNPKSKAGRNVVYHVYDIRSTMSEFCASFAVRAHAVAWGEMMFGEHAYVSDRRLHHNDHVWDGRTHEKRPDVNGFFYCAEHGHEQTVPCPDCGQNGAIVTPDRSTE